jgi:IS1 family transposase
LPRQKLVRPIASSAKVVNVPCCDIECDELWSFIGKKQKRIRPEDDQNLGDAHTFVAIERNTKLVLNIALGKRDLATTDVFVEGLRHATSRDEFQVTTDGFAPYRSAITTTLHDKLSGFAVLIKVYRASQQGEARYSPAEVQSVEVVPVSGQTRSRAYLHFHRGAEQLEYADGPSALHAGHTNAFSKKWENHWAAVALWYCWYDFGRVHKALRMMPAMAAGIADHIWTVRDLLEAA